MFHRIKTILVADDSPYFREFFCRIMTDLGLSVLLAEDGQEAVEILLSNKVEILVSDFEMPRRNGVQLLQWCRDAEFYFPVIFTTSKSIVFRKEEIALADCCATLLYKPIDLTILYAALRAAENFDHHPHCLHSSFADAHKKAATIPFNG